MLAEVADLKAEVARLRAIAEPASNDNWSDLERKKAANALARLERGRG